MNVDRWFTRIDMLIKEYRICMPMSVEEYQLGQLYMIAKHSHEQSENGEGVEVIRNEVCTDPVHGIGRYTEKRVHLSSRLPSWVRAIIPAIFYITEKAWNYFPYTITEYNCSFIPKFSIHIETRYEDDNGSSDNCLKLTEGEFQQREVDFVDIAVDELSPKHYKEEEDPKLLVSKKTGRGPLQEGWRDTVKPIMCSYKVVRVKFEVFGLQGRVESFAHKAVRDILLLGHRQAFAWIDDWYGLTLEDIREYETKMNHETNEKVMAGRGCRTSTDSRHSSTASRHSSSEKE